MSEQEMRAQILDLVKEYCDTYHNQAKPFKEGDRISYASGFMIMRKWLIW